MWLLLLAYLGGVLTIASPCVLPVLPFVFARAGQPFARSGLPLLAGMVLMFAIVGSLAAVGGNWVVAANQYGRWLALVLVAFFGLALLVPGLASYVARPFVRLGNRLTQVAQPHARGAAPGAATKPDVLGAASATGTGTTSAGVSASGTGATFAGVSASGTGTDPVGAAPGTANRGEGASEGRPGVGASLLLGIATGLLWTPCAGPILGLILTAAALQGANLDTTLLLLVYALGAATSLTAALLLGGRVFKWMKRSLGMGEWVRRGLGAAMVVGAGAIALGVDTTVLAQASLQSTTGIEQALVDRLAANGPGAAQAPTDAQPPDLMLPIEGMMPSLAGAVQWLNSPPLTNEGLRGKVVLVDFWTYSCINCLRTLPYLKAWAQKYRDAGLVVIGVHSPEFAFERDIGNVKQALKRLGVEYPVAIDNNYAIWRGFDNRYWPAHYFVDAKGRIRYHHFGEGDYDGSEEVIRQLLRDAGAKSLPAGLVSVRGTGVQEAPDWDAVRSEETYIGYDRSQRFSSGAQHRDKAQDYSVSTSLPLNGWGLSGTWTVGNERATLDKAPGSIVYHFQARDLNLVLGPAADGKPVRFRITLDGQPPGDDHGVDVAPDGTGTVTEQRLYQLVRQSGTIKDRTLQIEFLDAGGAAYAFTFG